MTEVTLEATASLEDMFLVVFCLIDDLYQAHVPQTIQRRSQDHRIACSRDLPRVRYDSTRPSPGTCVPRPTTSAP